MLWNIILPGLGRGVKLFFCCSCMLAAPCNQQWVSQSLVQIRAALMTSRVATPVSNVWGRCRLTLLASRAEWFVLPQFLKRGTWTKQLCNAVFGWVCSQEVWGQQQAVALVREAEISARTSKLLGSGEAATSTSFADHGFSSALSLGFISHPPFLDLLPPKVNTHRVGQIHWCNMCKQDLKCEQ